MAKAGPPGGCARGGRGINQDSRQNRQGQGYLQGGGRSRERGGSDIYDRGGYVGVWCIPRRLFIQRHKLGKGARSGRIASSASMSCWARGAACILMWS